MYTHAHTHTAHGMLDVSPGVGTRATPSPCKPLQLILQLELCPRNRQSPRQPMVQVQLRCHTGIMWSSALVRAPSSLFMVRTPFDRCEKSFSEKFYFHYFCATVGGFLHMYIYTYIYIYICIYIYTYI